MFILLWFQVWKAEAENICGYDGTVLVAVKTTKEKAPDKEKSDLLQEMQIMQKIGHHPNVVTLLGVSIDKGTVCWYFLYMELSIQYVGWSDVFKGASLYWGRGVFKMQKLDMVQNDVTFSSECFKRHRGDWKLYLRGVNGFGHFKNTLFCKKSHNWQHCFLSNQGCSECLQNPCSTCSIICICNVRNWT